MKFSNFTPIFFFAPEIYLKRVYFQPFFDKRIARVFKIQTKLDIKYI